MVILSERHLYRLMDEYVTYFNRSRPHQGIGQRISDPPNHDGHATLVRTTRVIGRPVLAGLHHDYRRVA